MTRAHPRRRDETGQATLLILGFATLLLIAIAAVVDASAAFMHRQSLNNLADGAALYGADLGAHGAYDEGVPRDRLLQQQEAVRQSVLRYLKESGAHQNYPGIRPEVRVDAAAKSVTVTLRAPIKLPLRVPGSPGRVTIGASGTAAVRVLSPG